MSTEQERALQAMREITARDARFLLDVFAGRYDGNPTRSEHVGGRLVDDFDDPIGQAETRLGACARLGLVHRAGNAEWVATSLGLAVLRLHYRDFDARYSNQPENCVYDPPEVPDA